MSNRLRVLIAEDHFVTRMGLKAILSAEPDIEVVAESDTGPDTVVQYRTHRPDVGIVDLRLPEMSGVEVIEAIRSEFNDAKLIVLTGVRGQRGRVSRRIGRRARVPPQEHERFGPPAGAARRACRQTRHAA